MISEVLGHLWSFLNHLQEATSICRKNYGVKLDLDTLEGIATLNIPNMHGGIQSLENPKQPLPNGLTKGPLTNAKELKFASHLSDQLLEVVAALERAVEMAELPRTEVQAVSWICVPHGDQDQQIPACIDQWGTLDADPMQSQELPSHL